MKYMFLNHFAFENINISKNDKNIVDVFNQVAYLLKDLRDVDYELIFDNKLSLFNFKGNNIQYYFKLIDKEIKILLTAKIQKSSPFCSDSFDKYYEDENIVLGNCVVENTEIEIIENFLACALFLDSPIITPKIICRNSPFLNNSISIICDKEKRELKNYFLEDRSNILEQVETEIKNNTKNWSDWETNTLFLYKNIKITKDCLEDMKIYSYSSDISKSILAFIENIDKFVEGKFVASINYEDCCSNTKRESETRLKDFKRQLTVNKCDDVKEVADWHTWIKKDFDSVRIFL